MRYTHAGPLLFLILHSPFLILHSPYLIIHSSFPIPHSPFLIPHSPFHSLRPQQRTCRSCQTSYCLSHGRESSSLMGRQRYMYNVCIHVPANSVEIFVQSCSQCILADPPPSLPPSLPSLPPSLPLSLYTDGSQHTFHPRHIMLFAGETITSSNSMCTCTYMYLSCSHLTQVKG